MIIRKLLSEDFHKYNKEIFSLFLLSFQKSFPEENFSSDFIEGKVNQCLSFVKDDDAFVYGILENDNLVAFIYFYEKQFFEKKILHINHITVLESFQNKGYGSMLLKYVNDYAKQNNIMYIDLDVSVGNNVAFNLYNKLGFVDYRVNKIKKVD